MYFKQYSSNEATLKEWSRQLTIANKGNYMTYSTVESTIYNWKQNLNNIYNK